MNDHIIVLDSHPGSGKTSWAIQYINSLDEDTKVIYITPFLDEVQRIIASCPSRSFIQPDKRRGKGRKLTHLIKLIYKNANVVSTHALFSNINDELLDALRYNNYILILDEVFSTVEKFDIGETHSKDKDDITRKDVETLLAQNSIRIEDDFRIKWNDPNKTLSKYNQLFELSERDLIYFVNGSLLLWTFPTEVFSPGVFDSIFILTHRFETQLQAYYYNYFNINYVKYYVKRNENEYEIFQGIDPDELNWIRLVKEKIIILDNSKLNKIGDPFYDNKNRVYLTALSKNWYVDHYESLSGLKDNLMNYFINITKSKASERLWTTFKDFVPKIKSKNVTVNSFLASNARATNDYADRKYLAYLINKYFDPFYQDFFEKKGIYIDQDQWALSDMIQWIWRSAIRNYETIYIYIPSYRMRKILIDFLMEK